MKTLRNFTKLKEFLTLTETAQRISLMFSKQLITIADVLQLALDGHLQLSINLVNGSTASRCARIDYSDPNLEFDYYPGRKVGDPPRKVPRGGRIFRHGGELYQAKAEITLLEKTIWDLPMIGNERVDVQNMVAEHTGGVEVEYSCTSGGTFLASPSGDLFQVQRSIIPAEKYEFDPKTPWNAFQNYTALGVLLPELGEFVVRRTALEFFEQNLEEPEGLSIDRPLLARERRALLTTLAVVCEYAKLDIKSSTKTALLILNQADMMGVQLGKTTVENYLKDIPEALGTRAR